MLRSGLFSCVRLRRSRLGVLRFAVLSSGRVCSGGQVGVSLVMLCYFRLWRSRSVRVCSGTLGKAWSGLAV